MFSEQHTHAVCTGIAAPGTKENQPYEVLSAFQRACLINAGQHYCHIEYSEKSCNDLVCMKLRVAKYKYTHAHDQQCHHKHHTIRYKIKYQIQIVYNGSHISDDTRCTFLNTEYTVQFKQSDQSEYAQYCQQQIAAVNNK